MARTAAITLMLAIATALLPSRGLRADVDAKNWHHKVEIPRPPRKGKSRGPAIGNLWIPPKTEQLNGLIVAEKTLLEKRLATSPIIRMAATQESLGILYFEPGPNPFFPYGEHGDCDRDSGQHRLGANRSRPARQRGQR